MHLKDEYNFIKVGMTIMTISTVFILLSVIANIKVELCAIFLILGLFIYIIGMILEWLGINRLKKQKRKEEEKKNVYHQ